MKNNWILILFVSLLVIASVIYFTNNKGTIKKELRDFAVKDTSEVTKIFMADKDNISVTLIRKDGYWTVNNKYVARPDAINILLETIASVTVKAPVSKSGLPNIIKRLAAKSVKVEIYKGDELVKVYYVGEPTADQTGTYMVLKNSSVPFITYKPGFSGYLSVRYFVDETIWRDVTIFQYSFQNIASVSVNLQASPDKAFTAFNDGNNKFHLFDLNKKEITGFDTLMVKEFIARFRKIKCESYLNEFFPESRLDSLLKTKPVAILSVTNRKGEINTLKLYTKPNFLRYYDDDGKEFTRDPDAMYGVLHGDKQVVSCQYFVFDPLMKDLSYFFQKKRF